MNSNQNLDVQTVERFAQVECEEFDYVSTRLNLQYSDKQAMRIACRLNAQRAKVANGNNWAKFEEIHADEDYLASLASLKKIEALMDRI